MDFLGVTTVSRGVYGVSNTLIGALASRHGLEQADIVRIVEEVLADLHRVAIQSEYGPYGAIYASRFLISEKGQYHLANILIEYLAANDLEDTSEIVTDLFRFESPSRDHWNETTRDWIELRHPDRKIMDDRNRRKPCDGGSHE